MATYQGIKGLKVKYLSADPSNLVAGDVWYNSVSNTFKSLVTAEAWSSAFPMSTTRSDGNGAGTQTACLYGGGVGDVVATEEFNGSSWTAGGDMNHGAAARGSGGTLTAGLAYGGTRAPATPPAYYTNPTEEYDGSTWTTVNAMPVGKASMGSGGTQTAALSASGVTAPSPADPETTASEEYDGTNWTSGGVVNTARRGLVKAVMGTQTAGLIMGGRVATTAQSATEEYDGTSWTSVTSYPQNCRAGGAAGTQTSSIACGGQTTTGSAPTTQTTTCTYDGTNWTTSANLGTARYLNLNNGADATASITCAGFGSPGAVLATTEEFNKSTTVITGATWAAGGNLNTARNHSSGLGATYDTAMVVQGGDASRTTSSESYDGSSWTATNSALTSSSTGAGTGTAAAGIIIEGYTAPTTFVTGVEEWDGTNWTDATATGASHYSGTFFGQSQTSAVAAGGMSSWPLGISSTTEIWNGSSWTTAPGALIPGTAVYEYGIMAGTETAGLVGNAWPAPYQQTSYEFDGATWTSGGSTAVNHNNASSFGSQTDAMVGGGANGPPGTTTDAEGYDGTAWTTRPSQANTSKGGNRGSTSNTTSGGLAAGINPSPKAATEEYNGETSAVTASTLTTS